MDAFDLNAQVLAATAKAEARVRADFERSPTPGALISYEGNDGVWETAEAIGILHWQLSDMQQLREAVRWLCEKVEPEGGYKPMPDVSSMRSYVEPTARVAMALAGTSRVLTGLERRRVNTTLTALTGWLVDQQDEETDGWGSRKGFPIRTTPTTGAIQALHAFYRTRPGSKLAQRADEAAKRGAEWLRSSANPDGGYGVRLTEPSTIASSGQAAWALSSMGIAVPPQLQAFIQRQVEDTQLDDDVDKIGDPAQTGPGRFELILLGRPWALIGLLSARGGVYARSTLGLVERILGEARDGVWEWEGRYVWPTYFHVVALRLWSWVHAAHAQAATVDLVGLIEETAPRALPSARPLRAPAPPIDAPEARERVKLVESLTTRERQVIEGIALFKSYQVIALELDLAEKTVGSHKSHACEKLKTSDRAEIQRIAIAAGLIGCPCEDLGLPGHGNSAEADGESC